MRVSPQDVHDGVLRVTDLRLNGNEHERHYDAVLNKDIHTHTHTHMDTCIHTQIHNDVQTYVRAYLGFAFAVYDMLCCAMPCYAVLCCV